MDKTNLASPELGAVEIEGMGRSSFLLKGALAVGAVYGASAVTPFVKEALAQEPIPGGGTGDVGILNFALTLEYLEADFYAQGQKLNLSSEVQELAKLLGDHEQEHVDALVATIKKLNGKPVAKPKFSFPMNDQASFLKLAQTLEDTGVSAYNGAAPSIKSKEVLGAAGSIVQIEARHAAAIRLQTKENPAPSAFDSTLDAPAVLKAVKPFIKA